MKVALLIVSIIIVISTKIQDGGSARILAYIMTTAYSHQSFFQPLWRELALRGHDMVVVTSEPTNEALPHFKEISIKDSIESYQEFMKMMGSLGPFSTKVIDSYQDFMETQWKLPQIQELITNETEHFDVLFIQHFQGPFLRLKHIFKCPMIGVLSMDGFPLNHGAMGNPVHPILYPHSFFTMDAETSFRKRLISTVFHVAETIGGNLVISRFEKTGDNPGMGIFETMQEETDMLFINANPVFTAIRPLTPSTINLAGGLHLKSPKDLPADLKVFLDSAPEGVIYLSFGTNVKSSELSLGTQKAIMDTLKSLPYKVLWKFEADTLKGKPDNVKIAKWVPQQDVLRHSNVKLFITQGGIQSLEEALYLQVPMIVVPFLTDQAANSLKVVSKGLGLALSPENLNADNFKKAILEVINDPKYKVNLKRLATQVQDQPMTPLERAVWWTEYVLRHKGAKHLRGPKIPTYQFYYFDVIGFLGIIVVTIIGLVIFVLKLIYKNIKLFRSCPEGKLKSS